MSWDGFAGLLAAIVTFGWSLTWSQETPPDAPPPPPAAAIQRPQLDQATLEGLRAAIANCWHLPESSGHEGIRVRIYVEFDRSGRVASTTALVPEGPGLSAELRAAVAAAEQALTRCQPYDLPEPFYEGWRTMIIKFDPSSGPPAL